MSYEKCITRKAKCCYAVDPINPRLAMLSYPPVNKLQKKLVYKSKVKNHINLEVPDNALANVLSREREKASKRNRK